MIEIRHLDKSFGEKQIFRDFSCSFPEGETTCIMGPSGCGKTTLLNLLLGLEQPDSGSVSGMAGKKRSMVFQENRLVEEWSRQPSSGEPAVTRKEAEEMLRALGLSDSLHQPVRTLSGGMRRRVSILRALAAEYDILFADEPFKGLDEKTKSQVISYFQEKTRGKTVLLVTHDREEAQAVGGFLLELGNRHCVFSSPEV
ncbi:MAG: ATP-binding cassette domain-containing protein [Eubacteriales bacterium]